MGQEKVRKHISIREDQEREVENRSLNLSKFVRKRLDEWSEK